MFKFQNATMFSSVTWSRSTDIFFSNFRSWLLQLDRYKWLFVLICTETEARDLKNNGQDTSEAS